MRSCIAEVLECLVGEQKLLSVHKKQGIANYRKERCRLVHRSLFWCNPLAKQTIQRDLEFHHSIFVRLRPRAAVSAVVTHVSPSRTTHSQSGMDGHTSDTTLWTPTSHHGWADFTTRSRVFRNTRRQIIPNQGPTQLGRALGVVVLVCIDVLASEPRTGFVH